jgi:hypothetical protein
MGKHLPCPGYEPFAGVGEPLNARSHMAATPKSAPSLFLLDITPTYLPDERITAGPTRLVIVRRSPQ